MCRVPVAAAAPAHAPPPAWLDVAPVPPPLAPADDLPPLGEDDASMLDALLLGAGVKAEVKAEAPFFAAAPPPPYSAPSGPYALAGLYAAYGLEPSAVASLTHANAQGLAATAERGGRKGKRSVEEVVAQIERVKKRRRESAQRSRARKSAAVKNMEVENRELKREVARLRAIVEALVGGPAAPHVAALAAAAAARGAAAAGFRTPGLAAADSTSSFLASESPSSVPTEASL